MTDFVTRDGGHLTPPRSGSLLDAVAAMLDAGLTEKEVAEVLARTPAEDEYKVIREVLGRRSGV